MNGMSAEQWSEAIAYTFPLVVVLFVGIAVGIACLDTPKSTRHHFGHLWARVVIFFRGHPL
jgi:hypothetical protein